MRLEFSPIQDIRSFLVGKCPAFMCNLGNWLGDWGIPRIEELAPAFDDLPCRTAYRTRSLPVTRVPSR